MANLPQIPGAKKRGVLHLSCNEDFKKIEEQLINDTVCINGPARAAFGLACSIHEKYKVGVKVVTNEPFNEPLPVEIEAIASPIREIVGEGRAEAVKFENGKAVGVGLVLFIDEQCSLAELGIKFEDNCDSSPNFKGEDMSDAGVLIQLGTKGSEAVLNLAKSSLDKAIQEKGAGQAISFPETNYYFPLINALLKSEARTLGDCAEVLKEAEKLNNNKPASSGLNISALGGILNKGLSTLLCEEVLAALQYLSKAHPKGGAGFLSDTLLRSLGIQLVDGRIAGIAVILGPAKDEDSAVQLVRDFQSRSIVSLLVGNVGGNTLQKQLENKKIELGLENYIVPLGEDYLSAIYAANWAVRAPLMYGGHKAGQWENILNYTKDKVPAFIVLLSHVDEVIVATGLGVLAMGFPIITDLEVPQLPKIDTTLYEALVTEKDYKKLAGKCIETRGLKVKIAQIPVPVPYAAAFEGERVRREQLHVEFGGKASSAFEFLTTKNLNEVEDGNIDIIGPDAGQLEGGNKSLPLAIIVEVAGRKMQKDFEPILERQIHRFVNYAMGLMHVGQRDMNWIRISKDAFEKGFRLKHIGIILHAMLHQEYSAIVDKVQVKLYTKLEDVEGLLPQAKKAYDERDERLSGMTDESVDTFYSCLLCQSFAPNHICVITPERLGLCGAYSWLDGKASFEITPTGPNQPILKGEVLDKIKGQWKNINDFVFNKSNKTIDKVNMYSLMDSPQSSCGCFECIVAIIPEVNGMMIVHRDYSGMTPCGMTFTTLAGSVGGGVQTPGFLGIGKLYVASKKFISAEGGLKRVVWMPKELKELLADKLKGRAEELGVPDLVDKIADETQATTIEELVKFLQEVKHPVLELEPLF
ncbi:MAG: CO dehydrogenase/CO-methylating acetyl-CoA synthase complex subunit beta [Candidatus Omnitrophica bacterium]|nr:CO dehydrogenase/CO-methylating acetyl-CoA synthase complex subunit beta [Candidatus Omnitrophota bacterium]